MFNVRGSRRVFTSPTLLSLQEHSHCSEVRGAANTVSSLSHTFDIPPSDQHLLCFHCVILFCVCMTTDSVFFFHGLVFNNILVVYAYACSSMLMFTHCLVQNQDTSVLVLNGGMTLYSLSTVHNLKIYQILLAS